MIIRNNKINKFERESIKYLQNKGFNIETLNRYQIKKIVTAKEEEYLSGSPIF